MSVVLVVGSSGSGKKTLLQGLLQLLETDGERRVSLGTEDTENIGLAPGEERRDSAATADTASRTPDRRVQVSIEQAEAEFDVYKALIRTKYYRAEVALWRQASALSILALRTVTLEGLQGIVVVFDLRQESSLEEAEQWAAFVDHKQEEVAFRLCVGTKLDLLPENVGAANGEPVQGSPPSSATVVEMPGLGKKEKEVSIAGSAAEVVTETASEGLQERRRRCLEWCLDHGFEYVEADCLHPEVGRDFREKEGMPRVAEAFQSNVWTGMEFRTDSRPSALPVAGRGRGIRRGGSGDVEVGCTSTEGTTGIVLESNARDQDAVEARASTWSGHEGEAVSEYLEGFVNPAEGGDDDFGYGALSSDDGNGGEDGEGDGEPENTSESASTAARIAGCVIAPGEGGVAGGSVGGGGEGQELGEEKARSDGVQHLQGSGIEPAHVELQARWEIMDREPAPDEPDADKPPDRRDGALSSSSTRKDAVDKRGNPSVARADHLEETGGGGDGEETSPFNIQRCGDDRSGYGAPSDQGAWRDVAGCGDGVPGGVFGVTGRQEATAGGWEPDEMELLMAEVRKARELGDAVSDEERRARAANVATRLAALLGGEDSEEEEYG